MKKTVIWGSGQIAEGLIRANAISGISFILDNDKYKTHTLFFGYEVIHPDEISEWKDYFIIIAVRKWNDISEQLDRYGLRYGQDYIDCFSYDHLQVDIRSVQNAVKKFCFKTDDGEFCVPIDNYEAFSDLRNSKKNVLMFGEMLTEIYRETYGDMGLYFGYCPVCNRERVFHVNTVNGEFNWRESVADDVCMLNLRQRFIYSLCRDRYKGKKIYMHEQITNLFRYMSTLENEVVGSEYISPATEGGTIVDGVRHEDVMNLSFDDGSFDVIVSCDVLEHVNDPKTALKEAYRCLKTNGTILMTVPFNPNMEKNVRRAFMRNDGSVENHLPPVYHGNPLSKEGSLVFHDFGWELLEDMRSSGFKDAHLLVYYSPEKGYVSNRMQFIFEGNK